jgi:predicted RNA-binding Zn ribbon-like protein
MYVARVATNIFYYDGSNQKGDTMETEEQLREALQRMPNLTGERLCLDFANSIEPRGDPSVSNSHPSLHEYLTSYGDLIAWGIHTHLLSWKMALRLLHAAERHPAEAQAIFERAIALRETIYRVFWMVAQRQQPSQADLDMLKREHLTAVSHTILVSAEGRFVWQWEEDSSALDRILWPIAQSATGLLTSEDLERIKVCPGVPGDPIPCAWLFYDTSKNRVRQWCSMADCGSVAKARRLTERRRSARTMRSTHSE